MSRVRTGVLAVQGAFIEHERALESLGVEAVELRQKPDIKNIDALILPGGESTVQGKLLRELDMFDTIRDLILCGIPVLATCAGLILLAENIENDEEKYIASLPVSVKRNAYGRQLGSFIHENTINESDCSDMVFIRAPYITGYDPECEVIAGYEGNVTGVRYKNQIGLSFHPELSGDLYYHRMLLSAAYKS